MNSKVKLVFASGAPAGRLEVKYGNLVSAAEIPAGAEEWFVELTDANTATAAARPSSRSTADRSRFRSSSAT